MSQTYQVDGMTCGGCASAIAEALTALPGVENVEVDLDNKAVTVTGNADQGAIRDAVEDAGFTFVGGA